MKRVLKIKTYHRLYIVLESGDLLLQVVHTDQVIHHDGVDLELLDSVSDGDQFGCNIINNCSTLLFLLSFINVIFILASFPNIPAPQRSPSISMDLTASSSFSMGVSSSQGLTSSKREDLATTAGLSFLPLAASAAFFLSSNCFSYSSSSSSSSPKRSTSSSSLAGAEAVEVVVGTVPARKLGTRQQILFYGASCIMQRKVINNK